MLDKSASIRDAIREKSAKTAHHLPGGRLTLDDWLGVYRYVARHMGVSIDIVEEEHARMQAEGRRY